MHEFEVIGVGCLYFVYLISTSLDHDKHKINSLPSLVTGVLNSVLLNLDSLN